MLSQSEIPHPGNIRCRFRPFIGDVDDRLRDVIPAQVSCQTPPLDKGIFSDTAHLNAIDTACRKIEANAGQIAAVASGPMLGPGFTSAVQEIHATLPTPTIWHITSISNVEDAIRTYLIVGNGSLKVAAMVGRGSDTVQRVRREMVATLAEAA